MCMWCHRAKEASKGDAVMPLLFCLGQQEALQAVQRQMEDGERLFAFLDDVYVVTCPERVGKVYRIFETALRVFSCIRIHNGKTKIWNKSGTRPVACDRLERIARAENQQGINVLNTPQNTTISLPITSNRSRETNEGF